MGSTSRALLERGYRRCGNCAHRVGEVLVLLKQMLLKVFKTIGEVVVSLGAVIALGGLFDRMNWPLFHSWGLMHGSFFLLFPMIFLAVHLMGKRLDNVWEEQHTATLSMTSYMANNWKTFIAFLLGCIGFMIPFVSIGGLAIGLQLRKRAALSVDKGLLTASLVVSSLGVAFTLYMILTLSMAVRASNP